MPIDLDNLLLSVSTVVGNRHNRPLSLEDYDRIEKNLDFRLPILVKRLFTELTNGGFGPQSAILPLEEIVEIYADFRNPQDLSLEWRAGMIPFCDWGCMILTVIDVSDECDDPVVFRYEPNMSEKDTYDYLHGCAFRGVGLFPECGSLSVWLRDWMAGIDLYSRPYKSKR